MQTAVTARDSAKIKQHLAKSRSLVSKMLDLPAQ
jgi:hypothetical protein